MVLSRQSHPMSYRASLEAAFYRQVLAQELPWLNDIVRAKRTARLPVC